MAPKRARENKPQGQAGKAKKRHKLPKKQPGLVSAQLEDSFSDSAPHDDIVLVDSNSENGDESDIVVVSDEDVEEVEPPAKKARIQLPQNGKVTGKSGSSDDSDNNKDITNEVTGNNDFIGFGFASSSEESDDEEVEIPAQLYPWVKGQDHSLQKEIADWLTLEIKDFVNYISPSKEEIVTRNSVITMLKENISSFWPNAQAHVFGSCATDLYLPGSDIDMVVISTTGDYEQRLRLYQLSSFLRTNKLAKNIEVIAGAKVPIIKFVDPVHNIHVDISFERTNGIDAARRIRRWLDLTPGLRELVLIVKQFLRSRKLNNVHVGGLGGYATIIMVYHFLKLHPRVSTKNILPVENLGTLLIEFFELYGRNFSYDNLIISLNQDDLPRYLAKYKHPYLGAGRGLFCIVIQDPSDPNNNITRSSYNLRDLKKAFGGAFQLLTAKCFELHSASYKNRLGKLILGDIITFRGDSRDFNDERDLVVNSALISNDSESDGANGNDKYYFSDMSDEETPEQRKKTKRLEKRKEKKRFAKELRAKEEELRIAREKSEPKAEISELLGLDENSDEDLKKDAKRDYWSLKGLEAGG